VNFRIQNVYLYSDFSININTMATVHLFYTVQHVKILFRATSTHTIKYLECQNKIGFKRILTKQHKINSRNVEIRNQQAKVKELCSVIENLILIASKLYNDH
jgi:hypothetical protein